ncbi:unnamed protein product [Parajaminaea phylloscopi]
MQVDLLQLHWRINACAYEDEQQSILDVWKNDARKITVADIVVTVGQDVLALANFRTEQLSVEDMLQRLQEQAMDRLKMSWTLADIRRRSSVAHAWDHPDDALDPSPPRLRWRQAPATLGRPRPS